MSLDEPLLRPRRTLRSHYSVQALFRKQDISSYSEATNPHGGEGSGSSSRLARSLGLWDLIAYGLAATLGTGIFVTVGAVAQGITGPAVIFSFLLAGFASFLSAMCYSEFASRIPVSGSAYSFAYISLGEVVGWFVGWNLTLEYAISASAVAGGWTGYLVSAFDSVGLKIPNYLAGYTINKYITISPLSAAIVLICTLILLLGMKESARFNLVITVVNICIIFFFIIAGATKVKTSHWTPFFPFGIAGTWAGVGQVFFSYIGFDSVSTLAGEVKKPGRDLPVGIIGTLTVVTCLYITVALVLTGMVSYSDLNPTSPLSSAFKTVGMNWASTLIAFGSVTTITATTLTSLVGQPRIFYQMAKDGLIFQIFAKVNSKGVPIAGTVISGLLSATIALFFDLQVLLDMISIGTLLAFTVVCGGVIILRYEEVREDGTKKNRVPLMVVAYFVGCVLFSSRNKFHFHHLETWQNVLIWLAFAVPLVATFIPLLFLKTTNVPATFKTPLVPFVPGLGMLMNVWFIMSLSLESIVRLIIWTAIGMAIYFGYGIRNSTLGKREDHFATITN